MYLKSFSFSRIPENGNGWHIDNCELNDINLIAGKNASGKTRLLEAIDNFARLLTNEGENSIKGVRFNWLMNFENNNDKITYILEYKNNIFLREELKINGDVFLERDKSGIGSIKYEEFNKKIDFEVEKDKIIIVSKRDKKQHPFLEKIFQLLNIILVVS